MNIFLSSKIALSSFLASISIFTITNSALALTWNLSGIFDDGGTISGTFDYDDLNDIYSNVNIITTGGATLSDRTYTDELFISSDDSLGFIITDDIGDFDLTLDFVSSLTSIPATISLDITSEEEDFLSGDTRFITSGNVVAVPFEVNPTLGILILGGVWGISYLRKTVIKIK